MPTESIADQVRLDRVRAIFQQMLVPVLTTFVNAVIAASVLMPFTSKPKLTIWLLLMAALTATRLLYWRRFRGEQPSPGEASKWTRVAIGGALMSGTLWGVGGCVLVPRMDLPELFLAFLTGGMCAGAAGVYAAHLPTLLSFILPASLPVALRFAIQDSPASLAMGAMILVFALALSLAGQRFSGYFGAMSESRVRLAERTRELDRVNAQLRAEIAERERTEAMLRYAQKMEAIGRLTTGIAHDFGNILGLISGTVDLLQGQGQAGQHRASLLANLSQAVEQGSALMRQLLAFSRRQVLRPREVDLNARINDMAQLLAGTIGRTVKIELRPAPELWTVFVDADRLDHAILNLAINARDAMPRGGTLTIETTNAVLPPEEKAEDTARDCVLISLSDTGTGMTDEVLAQAFDPFFTTKPSGEGSGLGLSQVYSFVQQSGGVTRIMSELGRGTTVALYLPRAHQA